MPTFGSSVFGGPSVGGSAGAVGTLLSELVMPAYRIAGITKRARIGPSEDMYAEAIPELNRMIGGWNCARPNIFTIRIDNFALVSGQKVYTIGDGADFDMPRPQAIQQGVIILSSTDTGGAVRMPPMYQMDVNEWAAIALQNISNGIPLGFYYDSSYDTETGYGRIYLWPQTSLAYMVEWYTWRSIPTFETEGDQVALPPGYQDAIVYNLAARLAALNPEMAKMAPESYAIGRRALAAIQSKNGITPKMVSDYPSKGGAHYDYRIGLVR
jgi:hypothetical protein